MIFEVLKSEHSLFARKIYCNNFTETESKGRDLIQSYDKNPYTTKKKVAAQKRHQN